MNREAMRFLLLVAAVMLPGIAKSLPTARAFTNSSSYSCPPLHRTVYLGRINEVLQLLVDGHDPDLKDEIGLAALGAVAAAARAGKPTLPKMYGGYTPLHYAAYLGDVEIAKLLVEHGADPQSLSTLGNLTPLHIAAYWRNEEMVQFLLEVDADPNTRSSLAKTALHSAVEIDNSDYWQTVIEKRSDTAYLALHRKNAKVVKILATHLPDLDSRDMSSRTALDAAVSIGNIKMAKLLLELGANPNGTASGFAGWRPLRYAEYRNSKELIDLLISYGADPQS